MQIASILKQLNQPYLLVTRSKLKLVMTNKAAEQLLGVDELTLSASELWHSEIASRLIEANSPIDFNIVVASNIININGSIVDDDYLVLHLTSKPLESMANDLSGLIDNLGAYVYCKDLNYRYTYANQEVCKLFESSLKDIVGKGDHDFFDDDTAQRLIEESDGLVLSTGQAIEKEELNFIPSLNEYRHYLTVKKPTYDADNNLTGIFGISTDITEFKLTQAKLRENEQALTAVLDNVGAYIFIKDKQHRYKYVNKALETLLNLTADNIVGKTLKQLIGQKAAESVEIRDVEFFKKPERVTCVEAINFTGESRYYWSVKIPMHNENGDIDSYIGIASDITDQKLLEQKLVTANDQLKSNFDQLAQLKTELQYQATHDALTGLYNRRFWEDNALDSYGSGQVTSLLMVDLDLFKQVNDTLGHSIGDEALKLVANVMKTECRKDDLVCRYGGEEFLIQLKNTSGIEALEYANRIRLAYQAQIRLMFKDICSDTLSVGLACTDINGETLEAVYQAADGALYQAKAQGRNCCILAQDSCGHD